MEKKTIIQTKLAEVGVEVDNVWDLVSNRVPYYRSTIPVLVDLLKEDLGEKDKEGIVRCLGIKEAKGIANKALLEEYEKAPFEWSVLRWVIGSAFYVIITREDVDDIIRIVSNPQNGTSRQMFICALGKMKTEKERLEDALIPLLDHDGVKGHTIIALRLLKSQKAKTKIESFLDHPNSFFRREAKKALAKIG